MSFSEIMTTIERLNLETQTVFKNVTKKNEENAEMKISLNRLNTQIQKQILYKKKLTNEINNIDKTKKEYEDELKDKLSNKRIMISKINNQFEEIQRLLAEKDDKNEFFDQQIKITNENCTNKNTTLLLKILESEKEDKHYKSLCKTLMMEDILSNDVNVANFKKLTEENIVLSENYHSSKKALKMALDNVELCKFRYGTYFDETYDRVNKTEILKLIMSTFNLLIANGYMCYWKSMAKVLTKNAVLWTAPVRSPSGMHFKVNFPFEDCSVTNNSATRVNENTSLITNNNQTDEGFKSLQY